MVTTLVVVSTPPLPHRGLTLPYRRRKPSSFLSFHSSPPSSRNPNKSVVSAVDRPHAIPSTAGSPIGLSLNTDESMFSGPNASHGPIVAGQEEENPCIMPTIITPVGPLDLSTVLFRNRIIFIGQPIFSELAQSVITQLMTLATINGDSDILIYMNSPGGNIYSVLAIYDCMSWIKPRVGTVGFGIVASHAAILLAGGEKGMRYAMPNARIMIHQPLASCGGDTDDVQQQVNEAAHSRNKIDKMYAALTGQPLEQIQLNTNLDRFFSAAEAMDFGLIDGIMETEY